MSKMASLKATRDALFAAYCNDLIDDEEYLILNELNTSSTPDFPYYSYERFDLNNFNEAECKAEFRFEKRDILLLQDVLEIPDVMRCNQRSVFNGTEGLCMLLKRLAYPCRYSDLISKFGRPVPVICMITNEVLDHIYDTHGHKLTDWNDDILNPVCLQEYADAIHNKGAPYDNCFGFVDGTVRKIARPGEEQRIMYNGHKRIHAIKFQSVALPNGLIGHLYGPVEGRKHDAGMLTDSDLLTQLQQFAFSPTGQPMCIYGDPAYPLRVHLQAPFRNAVLTPQMQQFNTSMSAVRVSVEWLFADIINYFKFLDFKNNLKVGLSCVGKIYIVAALLRNALTCLYGNNTCEYFDVPPPSLEDYFS